MCMHYRQTKKSLKFLIMVHFNVTTFCIQTGFRNVMSPTKFVFSNVISACLEVFFAAWVPPGKNEIFHLGSVA